MSTRSTQRSHNPLLVAVSSHFLKCGGKLCNPYMTDLEKEKLRKQGFIFKESQSPVVSFRLKRQQNGINFFKQIKHVEY